jgi:hypothetical protein
MDLHGGLRRGFTPSSGHNRTMNCRKQDSLFLLPLCRAICSGQNAQPASCASAAHNVLGNTPSERILTKMNGKTQARGPQILPILSDTKTFSSFEYLILAKRQACMKWAPRSLLPQVGPPALLDSTVVPLLIPSNAKCPFKKYWGPRGLQPTD